MMTQYVFGGASRQIGRFGLVETGQVLELDETEAAAVEGNPDYARVPTADPEYIALTESAALDENHDGRLIQSKHTAAVEYDLPTSPTLGMKIDIRDRSASGATTDSITVDPGATNVIEGLEKKVASIAVSDAGSGLSDIPNIVITGDGSDAEATAKAKVVAAVVAVAGTGYQVADVLTVAGGTSTTAATITVATVGGSGEILTLNISEAGAYSALPANDAAVTGGNGSDAEFTLDWGIESVTVTDPGTGYTEATAEADAGTGSVLEVTLAPVKKVMDEDAQRFGVYWTGAKWREF